MFMSIFILAVILGRVMPEEWRQQAKIMMSNESSRLYVFATQTVILVVLNLVLLVFAMMRFRRSRLI
jgi:TctA family transporter